MLVIKRKARYSFPMTGVSLVFFSFLPYLIWFFFSLIHKRVGMIHFLLFVAVSFIAVAFSVVARFFLEPFVALFPPVAEPFLAALVLTAFPEEVAKLLAVLPFSRGGSGSSVLPAKTVLARAVCIALAFASLETIFFAVRVPGALSLRFMTAVPLHASLTVFSACWLYGRLSHRSGSRLGRGYFMLVSAIMLHALCALGFEMRPPLTVLSAIMAAGTFVGSVILWIRGGDDDE